MKRPRTLLILLASVMACAAHAQSDIGKLAWLGGCWKLDGGERGTIEQWLPLEGGTLIGVSRTVKQGKTVGHEFMQIRPGLDGALAFHAQPSGQQPASFPVLRMSDTEVVFENLKHDFPHRVIYALEGDKLKARIEGVRGGNPRAIAYPMTRVSCDSLLKL